MEEEKMKEILKDLFEECGITDEKVKDDVIDKLFESRVLNELLPEIKCNIQNLQVVTKGKRGCLIYDSKYYFILSYIGKVFHCRTDKTIAEEEFRAFDNNEEI